MAEWKKRFWANTGSSYISMALRLGMGVFMFRKMFQGFNADQLGFWYLLWSLFGYGLLLDFGFGFTAQKAVAEKSATGDLEGLNRLLATIFWTFVAIAIGIFVVFGSISGPFVHRVLEKDHVLSLDEHRGYIQAYLIFFGGIGVMFPLGLFPEILRGRQRIDLANWVNVATTAINFGGLYAGFTLHWSFPVMMAISVITSVLPNVVAMFMAYSVLPGLSLKPSLFEWRSVKSQMSFSLAAYIIAFSNLLMSKTDQLVISMVIGAFAIAIYQAASKMGEMLETFAVQLQSALSPAAADLGARRDREGLVELLLRSSRLTFLLITPLYALSAAYLDPLIRLLTGMKTVEHGTLLAGHFLLLAIYSSQITNSCSKRILMMSGHERPLLWISVGDAVLNLILSVIFANTALGVSGVALGTLVATAAAGFFVVAPLTFSRLSLKFSDFIAFQAKGTLLPLGIFLAILAALVFLAPLHPDERPFVLLWQLAWRGSLAGIPVAVLSWPIIRSMTH